MPHVHTIYNGVKAACLSHVLAYLCCNFRDIELKLCIFLLTCGECVDSWLRQDAYSVSGPATELLRGGY